VIQDQWSFPYQPSRKSSSKKTAEAVKSSPTVERKQMQAYIGSLSFLKEAIDCADAHASWKKEKSQCSLGLHLIQCERRLTANDTMHQHQRLTNLLCPHWIDSWSDFFFPSSLVPLVPFSFIFFNSGTRWWKRSDPRSGILSSSRFSGPISSFRWWLIFSLMPSTGKRRWTGNRWMMKEKTNLHSNRHVLYHFLLMGG